jgi:hypothetical protein
MTTFLLQAPGSVIGRATLLPLSAFMEWTVTTLRFTLLGDEGVSNERVAYVICMANMKVFPYKNVF